MSVMLLWKTLSPKKKGILSTMLILMRTKEDFFFFLNEKLMKPKDIAKAENINYNTA